MTLKDYLIILFENYFISDPPRVVLKFGSNLDRENVLEGTDVYFDCIIDANPEVYKVEWTKNVSALHSTFKLDKKRIRSKLVLCHC